MTQSADTPADTERETQESSQKTARKSASEQNRWISDLHWRREGQQSRSGKTQTALMDAAEELVVLRGAQGASVADIAKKAGCSVGSFYHHFRDKTALLYAVFDRMTSEFQATAEEAVTEERWRGASISDILRGLIVFSQDLSRTHAGIAASRLIGHSFPELWEHFSELYQKLYFDLEGLLQARKAEIAHPNPDRAIRFVLDQLNVMLVGRYDKVLNRSQIGTLTDSEFTEEALDMICTHLGIEKH